MRAAGVGRAGRAGGAAPVHLPAQHVPALPVVADVVLGVVAPTSPVARETAAYPGGPPPYHLQHIGTTAQIK